MSAAVYVTAGGRRFHSAEDCSALIAGQSAHSDGSHYAGTGYLVGVWPVGVVLSVAAARAGYTACRVCVPPALALPATGETHGHKPVPGEGWFGETETICARCTHRDLWWGDPTYRMPVHVLWPCTSAVVLGLAARGAL